MPRLKRILPLLAIALAILAQGCKGDGSSKSERLLVKQGNAEFADSNYADARTNYKAALDLRPASEVAKFDLAAAKAKLGLANPQDTVVMDEALQAYEQLGTGAADHAIGEKANYNLGNLAFYAQNWPQAIEYYKRVLRSDPSNLKARENLRVAQLKMPPQDQQQQQNPNPQDQEQEQEQQQQQQQQEQEQQLSENAEQILQSMQNREDQTRREAQPIQGRPAGTDKPW